MIQLMLTQEASLFETVVTETNFKSDCNLVKYMVQVLPLISVANLGRFKITPFAMDM